MAASLEPIALVDLAGWQESDHTAAFEAFQRSCLEIIRTGHGFKRPVKFGGLREDWISVCQNLKPETSAARFFEENFQAFRVKDEGRPQGLFTGYFEPEAEGSRKPSPDYTVPLYAKPDDLVAFAEHERQESGLSYGKRIAGKPQPYFTRQEIEQGALHGRALEIVWLKSWEDAFFIHIQGSGRIRLVDGSVVRLAYAAKSGHPYTGIGGLLVERGVLTKETNSMQAIRRWMKKHPLQSRELMWQNRSFVFFREVEIGHPGLGALGAQQVNLTPLRSLAVDRSIWMFGTPIWLDTATPPESPDGAKPFRQLMIAQDTGSAIKGMARGDVYWGWGETAATIAGHMKSPGNMVVLLPRAVAKRLRIAQ